MSLDHDADLQVQGPVTDEETGKQCYTVHGTERDIRFAVFPETRAGEEGWGVEIEGIPDPGIARDKPWSSVQEARNAAIGAVRSILKLERMQREDMERNKPRA